MLFRSPLETVHNNKLSPVFNPLAVVVIKFEFKNVAAPDNTLQFPVPAIGAVAPKVTVFPHTD